MAKASAHHPQPIASVCFHHLPKCPSHIHPAAPDASAVPARRCPIAAQQPCVPETTTTAHHELHACAAAAPAVAPDNSPRDIQRSEPEPRPQPQQQQQQQQTPTPPPPPPPPQPQQDVGLIECKHWLEVHDPLHRYGTFLRAYYDAWQSTGVDTPFFDWLDSEAGRAVRSVRGAGGANKATPVRDVSREMLDSSRVHYCTWGESSCYEVHRRGDGRLVWSSATPGAPDSTGHGVVDTTHDDERWIFVVDECDRVLVNRKVKAHFHHSSFVAGRAVRAAGRISVRDGVVVMVSPNSGHYRTTREQLATVVRDVLGDDVVVSELGPDGPTES